MSGHRKYEVTRTDGSSKPGGKHEHCGYFVLDLEHDEFAIPALLAYASACRKTNSKLANEILSIVANTYRPCGCREACCPHLRFGPQNESEMLVWLMDRAAKP